MRGKHWTPIMLSAALVMALLPLQPGAAQDPPEVETVRLAGDDRYGTGEAVAGTFDPGDVDDVILTTGENFPDAVAAAGLAGSLNAPIALTRRDSIPDSTMAALTTLDPTTVWILGGPVAVSQTVEDALIAEGFTVERVAGLDRFATAAEAARQMEPPAVGSVGAAAIGEHNGLRTAFVAWGGNFPDALTVGPLAYAGLHPVFLVRTNSIPDSTLEALEDLNIEQVIVAGGTAVISEAVADELGTITGNPVIRVAGADRFGTAADTANLAISEFGFPGDAAVLAYGFNFPDALTAGPYGGATLAPIVLTASLRPATRSFLESLRGVIVKLTAVGGPAVISEETLEEARDAASIPAVVSWDPESLEAEVPAGDNVPAVVNLTVGEEIGDASLVLSDEIAGAVAASSATVTAAVAPGSYSITVGLFAPRDADVGSQIEGTLSVYDGDDPVRSSLPIVITVGEPDPAALDRVNLPAPGDVSTSDAGLLVTTEILMAPDEAAVENVYGGDPVAAANAIADRHDAEVIGRSTGADIFQLGIERIDDPEDLQTRWEAIDADDEVDFAGPRLFAENEAVFPNDPRWDDWDQDNPAGNNWHLEFLRAGDAWDRQTGSEEVVVAIIDGGPRRSL